MVNPHLGAAVTGSKGGRPRSIDASGSWLKRLSRVLDPKPPNQAPETFETQQHGGQV